MSLTLPVMESFHSLQGEGAHAGKSAFFIRLAGCKVGCSWCDTKESWSALHHPKESVEKLAKNALKAQKNGAAFLVITGGEPLHHNLDPLCKAVKELSATLNSNSLPIHLETSGVDIVSGSIDWITLSPKKHLPPKKELIQICQEIKVIIHSKEDIIFAREIANKAIKTRKNSTNSKQLTHNSYTEPLLYLQPGWGNDKGKELAIEYVKKNPQWRLSVQLHKWLGVD